jgi:tRNA (guanine-N7-)-methyltransferase
VNDSTLPPGQQPFHRTIRSFVLRTGRTTAGQAKAFTDVGPRFLLPYTAQPMDLAAAFERQAPTILEIGFGMGEATAQIAALRTQDNFLCCEVHTPGVGALLKRIAEQSLSNIRILQHDAVEVIDHMLPLASLDGAHIFFPDPWHKTKHNKRRLIQPPLIAKLAARLQPGGYLHCATDCCATRPARTPAATHPNLTTAHSPSLKTVASISATACGTWCSGGFR